MTARHGVAYQFHNLVIFYQKRRENKDTRRSASLSKRRSVDAPLGRDGLPSIV